VPRAADRTQVTGEIASLRMRAATRLPGSSGNLELLLALWNAGCRGRKAKEFGDTRDALIAQLWASN